MGCGGLPTTIQPGSSIPELINFVRHAFRECEFDEVQNALMEREKGMEIEILNLTGICDSLKKDIDFLDSSLRCADLEKSSMGKEIEDLRREKLGLEEKLESNRRECEERDDRLVRMGKEIEDLRREKLSLEEKLNGACSKCEERDDKLVRMGKEIEDLRLEKLSIVEKLNGTCSKCGLRSEKLSLEENLNRSCSKCEERNDKLNRMGKEIEDLTSEKLSLEENLNSTSSKCEERNDKLNRMGKEIEDLRSEKLSLEERLNCTYSKCEERDEKLVRMEKEIKDLRREKLSLEEKLDCSYTKCEEMEELLVQMGKDIDNWSHEKRDATQTINKLKGKEIATNQAIDAVRVRLETALAKMLCVNVEDLSKLINGTEFFAAAVTDVEEENVNLLSSEEGRTDCLGYEKVNTDEEDGAVMSLKVRATSDNASRSGGVGSSKTGGRDLVHSRRKEDGANVIRTSGSVYRSAAAERNGIVQYNEGKTAGARGSDGERRLRNKRGRIVDDDDNSAINGSAKRRTSTSTSTPRPTRLLETLTDSDSDDEWCSDEYMNKLVASLRSRRR